MPAIRSPKPRYLLQRQTATAVVEIRRTDCPRRALHRLSEMAKRAAMAHRLGHDQIVVVLLRGREISYDQLRYGGRGWAA